jgi:hypothetical protein
MKRSKRGTFGWLEIGERVPGALTDDARPEGLSVAVGGTVGLLSVVDMLLAAALCVVRAVDCSFLCVHVAHDNPSSSARVSLLEDQS